MPGDRITPTERELALAPDRFEPLDDATTTEEQDPADESAESDATGEDAAEPAEDPDAGDEDDTADESGENEASDDTDTADEADDPGLTAEQVEDADYNRLRELGREFDEVNGNWGEDRLRAELLDRAG